MERPKYGSWLAVVGVRGESDALALQAHAALLGCIEQRSYGRPFAECFTLDASKHGTVRTRVVPMSDQETARLSWEGFTPEQADLLDDLDVCGNNEWDRIAYTETRLPTLLYDLAETGLTLAQVKAAMASIGYGKNALHQLDRWDSKRRTGKFGR